MIEETDNKQGMQVKCIYLVGKWVISAMERNQTGKKERMPGLSKVIRESSLRRRHRRKDPKKGRERAMRKHGEWGKREAECRPSGRTRSGLAWKPRGA